MKISSDFNVRDFLIGETEQNQLDAIPGTVLFFVPGKACRICKFNSPALQQCLIVLSINAYR